MATLAMSTRAATYQRSGRCGRNACPERYAPSRPSEDCTTTPSPLARARAKSSRVTPEAINEYPGGRVRMAEVGLSDSSCSLSGVYEFEGLVCELDGDLAAARVAECEQRGGRQSRPVEVDDRVG